MNYTQEIINDLGLTNTYKIYTALNYYDIVQYDRNAIIKSFDEDNITDTDFDEQKLINTLVEAEYNNHPIIDMIMQVIYNQHLKEKITIILDVYNNFYNEITNSNYDIELIGQYLIDLAQYNYDTGAIDSDVINELIRINIGNDMQYWDDEDIKYYNALGHKLERYDIFINYDDSNDEFNTLIANAYDISEYKPDLITNLKSYNYIDLCNYIDEIEQIPERLTYYYDYDKYINNMHITRQIVSDTEKDTYYSQDTFLVDLEGGY